jgi:YfiH family protein
MIEAPLAGARVLFTTRVGGVSDGPYASRNLGSFTDDDPEVVRRNIDALKAEIDIPTLHLLKQVHGDQIAELGPRPHPSTPIADGAHVTDRLTGILITGADCPTAFLSDGDRLVGIHCGWRPVVAGIVEEATARFGGGEFEAVIGPGICQNHFEVGDEVIESLGEDGAAAADGRQLDLTAVIRLRLERGGATRVHAIDRCTFCEPDAFFSHRRDGGVTGRQAGVAWLS